MQSTIAQPVLTGYKNPSHAGRQYVGVWLSLVEHCVRDAGVEGSNPFTPTIYISVS